jgi:hypothetical protein
MNIGEKRKMQIARNKTMATLIALFLVLTIAFTLVALPTVNAAVNYYTEYVYVSIAPNLVGVNQQVLLVWWAADVPPDIGEAAGLVSSPSGRAGWAGVTLTVTRPDGTNETIAMPWSDPVGGGYATYVPTQIGTYYVQVFFPGTWKNTTANQYQYSSAVSEKAAFTVQQEPIQPWSESPLPSGYWTRPISGASRDWYVLAGNWLSGAANVWPMGAAGGTTTLFGYSTGPESAHIMWTKPLWEGGIMDERFGGISYTPDHYQGITFVPIILNGKIYYPAQYNAHIRRGWYCVDLYTGETLYYENDTLGNMAIPSFAQIYNYVSPNQKGGFPYLWRTSGVTISNPGGINGTVWEMLDAHTGNTVTKIANVTSGGTAVYGKDGSILRYNLVNLGTTAAPNYYLQVWNSSAIPSLLGGATSTNAWMWRPAGQTVHDGSKGFSLNVSLGNINGPRNALLNETGTIRTVREDKSVIVGTGGRNDERGAVPGVMMAFSLERGREGTRLWESTFTPPLASFAANVTISMTGVYPEDGVILFWSAKLLKRWGYNMTTGVLLWESEPEPALNYHMYTVVDVYQGMLITTGCSGVVLAYDMKTGEIVWNYTAGFDFLSESPYGNSPLVISCVADGKIYLGHTFWGTNPAWRDYIRCVNASNGVELWKILFCGRTGGIAGQLYIADGFVVGLNYLDNQIYCFGRGPSATTVSAPQTVPSLGSSVTITGTVTDQSPSGRRTTNDIIDWTLKGTPAISDEDMSAWMEYKFMQQAYPANAKGVNVTLTAIDPNNNYIPIGTTTTDLTGAYGFVWQPEVPGKYQIIATFAGSKSYGSSYAITYMGVGEAPPVPAAPEPAAPLPPFEMYTLYATIAIIIAIAIVGLMILRKRP